MRDKFYDLCGKIKCEMWLGASISPGLFSFRRRSEKTTSRGHSLDTPRDGMGREAARNIHSDEVHHESSQVLIN